MNRKTLTKLAIVASVLAPFATAQAADEPSPEDVVDALERITGVHKGLRRNHTKGVCATGSFTANDQGRPLSVSPLFSGQQIPVIARFSLAGPNPSVPDTARNPRGMALQFQLAGGELHQMAMLNTPVFGHATVESFYQKQVSEIPDPATGQRDPEKQKAFAAKFTDNKGQASWLASHNPPPSYAQAAYHSLNAFKFVAAGQSHWVKWRFQPRDGEAFLTDDELKTLPKDFLTQRLQDRTRLGPVQWDMVVTLGRDGDPIDNPSVAWPADRPEVVVGTLSLTRAAIDAAGACDDINFDPNVLTAGIEPSPDAILAYRSAAYAVSFSKRLGEKAQ